jgi:hypothetical protein
VVMPRGPEGCQGITPIGHSKSRSCHFPRTQGE